MSARSRCALANEETAWNVAPRGSPVMTQADQADRVSAKDLKRRQKRAWKREKLVAKSERRRVKQERKTARRAARRIITLKSRLPRNGAIELMEEIIAGIRAGRVSVEHDGESLQITPPEQVRVRIRARQTHKSEGVVVRVSWPRTDAFEESPSLEVSAGDDGEALT
jgi:amphi-Trp domain-containing protein